MAFDPPIDWASVTSREEVFGWRLQRDRHMAATIATHVLDRRRRALFIAGTLHVVRQRAQPPGLPPVRNVLQLVEERFPGATFVVTVHTGFGAGTCRLEERMSAWPRSSVTLIGGTWLGQLPARVLFSELVLVGPPNGAPTDP